MSNSNKQEGRTIAIDQVLFRPNAYWKQAQFDMFPKLYRKIVAVVNVMKKRLKNNELWDTKKGKDEDITLKEDTLETEELTNLTNHQLIELLRSMIPKYLNELPQQSGGLQGSSETIKKIDFKLVMRMQKTLIQVDADNKSSVRYFINALKVYLSLYETNKNVVIRESAAKNKATSERLEGAMLGSHVAAKEQEKGFFSRFRRNKGTSHSQKAYNLAD